MKIITRRGFIQQSLSAGIGMAALGHLPNLPSMAKGKMKCQG